MIVRRGIRRESRGSRRREGAKADAKNTLEFGFAIAESLAKIAAGAGK